MKRRQRKKLYLRQMDLVDDADLMEAVTRLHRRNRWRTRNRHEWEAELWDGYGDEERDGGPVDLTADDEAEYFMSA